MLRKYFLLLLSAFLLSFVGQTSLDAQPGPQKGYFPGMPGMAPSGKRWVPGHFEVINGQKVWLRGHYEKTDGDSPMPQPGAPQGGTPAGSAAPVHSKDGFVRPFDGTSKQWIPGHFEEVNGNKVWIRGHSAGEEGTATGPPAGMFNPPAAGQTTSGDTKPSGVQPQGWAVVIGISKYKYAPGKFPELRYAAKDARTVYNFLSSPEGGGFPPERILYLEDEKATLENIKYAFFDFLKQALEEDFVMVYFSGHGTPEEDNPKNLYLVAYDSQPERLASTAFPMWDIDTALSRHIKSKKVIMFADACHSAGITGDVATRSIYKNNMVIKHLLEVAQGKQGRVIFTASEAGELSQESKKWGGGHGVFTYFLLNALKGEADVNDDNIITLGEVIDFVSENVRRATNNTQHPDTAGVFDREFPVAVIR